ncbi:hypothetical protein PR048_000215, partial [Dryococelus australis]
MWIRHSQAPLTPYDTMELFERYLLEGADWGDSCARSYTTSSVEDIPVPPFRRPRRDCRKFKPVFHTKSVASSCNLKTSEPFRDFTSNLPDIREKKSTSDRGRKATGSCRITSSPYKNALKRLGTSPVKQKQGERKPKRQRYSDIELDLPVGKRTPSDEDATCMFCEDRFSDDKGVKCWFICLMCSILRGPSTNFSQGREETSARPRTSKNLCHFLSTLAFRLNKKPSACDMSRGKVLRGRRENNTVAKTADEVITMGMGLTCKDRPAGLTPKRIGSIPLLDRSRISACGNRGKRCCWSAGFLGDIPFPPTLAFRRCSILTSIAPVGSQDLAARVHSPVYDQVSDVCSLAAAPQNSQCYVTLGSMESSRACLINSDPIAKIWEWHQSSQRYRGRYSSSPSLPPGTDDVILKRGKGYEGGAATCSTNNNNDSAASRVLGRSFGDASLWKCLGFDWILWDDPDWSGFHSGAYRGLVGERCSTMLLTSDAILLASANRVLWYKQLFYICIPNFSVTWPVSPENAGV